MGARSSRPASFPATAGRTGGPRTQGEAVADFGVVSAARQTAAAGIEGYLAAGNG